MSQQSSTNKEVPVSNTVCCSSASDSCDLTQQPLWCWVFWRLPLLLIIISFFVEHSIRFWFWISCLLIGGVGCATNAARCARLHCYFTSVLYIVGAIYLLSVYEMKLIKEPPLYPFTFWFAIVTGTLGAYSIEWIWGVSYLKNKAKN
jgi:hypothetical protein